MSTLARSALVARVLASCAIAGCAIDTEIGLDATIESASASVSAGAGGDVVSVVLGVTYRVGEHAPESHELMPQSIDVFLADSLVATISPNRPPGFVPLVRPGQSFSTTFTGESRAGTATEPRSLCGEEATVLFRWVDASTGEIGTSEAPTDAVTCD